jgi:D-alanine-D-alanine ligase-like ATP-grasp enzyme
MQPCIHCGNNRVPHRTHKFYESLDIFLSPIRRTIFQSWFGSFSDAISTGVAMGFFHILKPLGLIQINRDSSLVPFERARVLWEEAILQNIDMEEIKVFNHSIDLYRARIKNKQLYFMNLPRLERVGTSNLTWIDDKYLLKKKLLQHHLPVAPGGSYSTLRSALKAFDALEKPLIVKPRAGSRGRHTTTFVYTKDALKVAFKIAKQLCHWVVIEEHLFGDVQRGTMIGGKLVGVLGGSSPQVTGDGTRTIAELIQMKNTNRLPKQKEIQINPFFLQRQNYSLDSVLEKDKTITLSEKIGVNYGGTSYDCTDETHPETKQMLEEVARILDISIIGLDFIIPDITKSYKVQKCGIIECNGAPFIQLHYDPLYGKTIPAAKYVWKLVM